MSLLQNMLQPGSSIRAQVPTSTPQANPVGDQGSDTGQQVLDTVKTAAAVAALFL